MNSVTSPVYIITILAGAVPVVILVVLAKQGVFGSSKAQREQAEQLVATGSKARAMMLQVQPTGVVVNNINLQCVVSFRLEPLDGGDPFEASKKMTVSQTAMPRAGDIWPSWYDQADHSQFAVGMPNGASTEQIPVFREFGIKHPLDSEQS
jgi:hypothetical protein